MRAILFFCAAIAATGSRAANMVDNDGDGLPDIWEAAFGLSTNSAAGINGADGDPDNDGLSNLAEYKAGYYVIGANVYSNYPWAVAGLNPTNAHSAAANDFDYYYKPAGSKVTLGWMLSDHDYVEDSWESDPANGSNPHLWDAEDIAFGWDKWDLCRMAFLKMTNAALRCTISYAGPAEIDTVTLSAFHSMSTRADATYTLAGVNKTFTLSVPSTGKLRHDSKYWLAVPGGTYTAGSPVGFAIIGNPGFDGSPICIDLRNPMDTLPTLQIQPNHLRINRSFVDGYTSYRRVVFDCVYDSPKLLTGLDFYANGEYGIDWGLMDVPTSMNREIVVYDFYLGNATILTNNLHLMTVTNLFDVGSDRAKAVATDPINGKYVYSGRLTFRWTMPEGYVAFAMEVRSGTSAGPVVYQSGTLPMPARDVYSLDYVWQSPLHSGDLLPNGSILSNNCSYAWRVIALNSKFTLTTTPITWSTWNTFRLSTGATPGLGSISANVRYVGAASSLLSGRVKVEAFDNRSFAGTPSGSAYVPDSGLLAMTNSVSGATGLIMSGLNPGVYYVRAYIDHNLNGMHDAWESWGYANSLGVMSATPFDVLAVTVSGSVRPSLVKIVIQDQDADADWFPDAWEYEQNPTADFLNLTLPGSFFEANPALSTL